MAKLTLDWGVVFMGASILIQLDSDDVDDALFWSVVAGCCVICVWCLFDAYAAYGFLEEKGTAHGDSGALQQSDVVVSALT